MSLKEIARWFPEEIHDQGEDMLREYLQYEILKLLFDSKYGHKYTFLGGTCLRIAYETRRFSEDLDFDNVGLSKAEFEDSAAIIQRGLELLGYEVSLTYAYKGAYHCKVRFPGLLFHYGLSPHKEARLLIKLDTEKQHFDYQRKIYSLNKFGVEADIRVTPLSLLASQKVAAIMGRKRPKGRDFYDLHFILQRTKPDYDYLYERFQVQTPEALREMLNERISAFDMALLGKDVAPFLMTREEVAAVTDFAVFWAGVEL